jgi:glycosyltransferase involved in cell wall biosynthesis
MDDISTGSSRLRSKFEGVKRMIEDETKSVGEYKGKTSMNKISIVIPALNEEKFLPNLLLSLTRQTNMDFEVVVVDGSSKDATREVAQSFSSKLPKLKVIVSEKAGISLQRNIGEKAAGGEWLIFIDADSTVLPYFIERIDWFINDQKPMFFTTWLRPDSELPFDALFTLVVNSVVEGSVVVHRSLAPGPLTIVRRDVFELVDGYDETVTFGEDYDITQRIGAHGIALQILRETLYVMSLRRIRRDGKLPFLLFYTKVSLSILLRNKSLDHVPSYIMGGHPYGTRKKKLVYRKLFLR